MQEYIKKIIKKVSFFTTQPDSDWRKVCIVLLILATGSLAWNVYFYFRIQEKIAESEVVQKSKVSIIGARQNEVQQIIEVYEKKKSAQATLITEKLLRLEDPSVL